MVFSCKKCNCEKDILTSAQYKIFRNLTDDLQKKNYKNECFCKNTDIMYQNGFCLPENWIEYNIRSKIFVNIFLGKNYKGKRYHQIKSLYKKYHHLPKPIIISSNNILLDGYLALMFAKNKQIKKIPIIRLENVIVEK